MNWVIKNSLYCIWNDFSLDVKTELIFTTSCQYLLMGPNGSGKTSFLKKILIPYLQNQPEKQYIIYIEQQIQSQFEAIKAYAALREKNLQLDNFDEMVIYLMQKVALAKVSNNRPIIIIADEFENQSLLQKWITELGKEDICSILISHNLKSNQFEKEIKNILFKPISALVTEVESL